jgi:hypothetical protein
MAYVRFALKYPARFQLMFRVDKHDHSNAEFVKVAAQSYQVLENAIRAATETLPDRKLGADAQGMLIAVWSLVHGFSHLALGGELGKPSRGGGGQSAILNSLLPLTLKHLPPPSRS